MADYIPTREDAYKLLTKHTETDHLIKHALAVEATMAHFAEIYGEDVEKWRVIGLIHDLDFDKWPDQHCDMTKKILEEENWPEDYIRAVMSHGYGIRTDVKPTENVEKVIYTIDELTGLVLATALMRPSKSILDMEAKSVKKKWKQKSFAAGVDRDIIEKGVEMLGMELNDVITETIKGMRNVAEEIGLKGDL
ncbi:HD domain-containing protein [Tissierella sp. Yu-01]|uniref:HD domain-containing protein n=1 Tax=Tissierella sp. Yu-01 TaxID=3035694 RepID=UPI00240E1EBE|nr:HD domain-containing protein [Tissierella sp. Yu-01]WFA10166.1 HDIG domain-containing protein [Tissierella sp. Yu-01]